MAEVIPIRKRRDRHFDCSLFAEYSESEVLRAVAHLPESELLDERSRVITRLLPDLVITAPKILWAEAERHCEDLGEGNWRCTVTAPASDPNYVLWFVEWPAEEEDVDCDLNSERDLFVAAERVSADNAKSAELYFSENLHKFRENLLRVQMEIERYNSALPYLISLSTEFRLDGFPVTPEAEESFITDKGPDLYAGICEELEAQGAIVCIGEEIDPKTGKTCKRYVHRDYARKSN